MSRAVGTSALPSAINRLVERLYRVFNAQSVVLFGSYASGQPTSRSDIDLLVVLPDQERLDEAERRRGQLVSGLLPKGDLVFTTPRELVEAQGERAAFLRSVTEQGLELLPQQLPGPSCTADPQEAVKHSVPGISLSGDDWANSARKH